VVGQVPKDCHLSASPLRLNIPPVLFPSSISSLSISTPRDQRRTNKTQTTKGRRLLIIVYKITTVFRYTIASHHTLTHRDNCPLEHQHPAHFLAPKSSSRYTKALSCPPDFTPTLPCQAVSRSSTSPDCDVPIGAQSACERPSTISVYREALCQYSDKIPTIRRSSQRHHSHFPTQRSPTQEPKDIPSRE
jgi:hypothetical protein